MKKSSIRYKQDVCKINNALDVVDKLQGRLYKSKGTKKINSGFIAEEVNQILPHLVGKDKSLRPDNIEYNSLIPYLVESIKELKKQNNNLIKEVTFLKNKFI